MDHIYEGNVPQPQRIVCSYLTAEGREFRWVVSAQPDFPKVGDVVPLVYDTRMGGAERQTDRKSGLLTSGVVLTVLSLVSLTAGLLSTYAF
ncbi:hypothetical protein [Streptomyces sp. NPDC093991]|uniref:hypothetical protein n=1 Tax=unclassified Streptomyces TaxID=2593676 RepID=UPI00343A6C7A